MMHPSFHFLVSNNRASIKEHTLRCTNFPLLSLPLKDFCLCSTMAFRSYSPIILYFVLLLIFKAIAWEDIDEKYYDNNRIRIQLMGLLEADFYSTSVHII